MNFVLCYVCINIHRLHSDARTTSLKIFCSLKILHNHFNNAKRDVRGKKTQLTTFGEGRERERKSESECKRDRLPSFHYNGIKVYWKVRSFVM